MADSVEETPIERLEHLMVAIEGERIEFKEAKRRYDFEELCQYASAIANEGGGHIVLGVTDEHPRQVVGSEAFDQPERTISGLNQRCHLRFSAEVIQHADGRVLVFTVPPHVIGEPTEDGKGRAWMRDGDNLIVLSGKRRRGIMAEAGGDFSADVCENATLADLAPEAIEEFRERWAKHTERSGNETDEAKAARIRRRGDQKLLEEADVIVDGKLTWAAVVLFATRAALRKHLAQAEIAFEYRSDNTSGPAQERVNFQEGFFLIIDRLWELIDKRNDRQEFQSGLHVHRIATFSERPVRELILNAVSHRDYQNAGNVFFRQYPRNLRCESPGGFPPGITVETVLNRQKPRNRRITEVFERCGLVERSGQGMDLMVETAVRQAQLLPSFEGTDDHQVNVTLWGEVQEPKFVAFLEKVGQEMLKTFDTEHFLVLDLIRRGETLPEKLKPFGQALCKLGVLESVGRGRGARMILSRELQAFLGKAGAHTRAKGLDREHNLQLLLAHLRTCGSQGAPRDEMQHVIPSLSAEQIGYRLGLLEKQGKVRHSGTGRGARWYIVEANSAEDGASE